MVAKLGAGGMGEVYRAEDLDLRRPVAIKVLSPRADERPGNRARFVREASLIGALSHPNVVTVHAIEEIEGLRLIVLELIAGRTLNEATPEGGFQIDDFLDVAIPLADAVRAAHDRGITHRDLKPANIMIADDGRVKVVDFGLAKLCRTDEHAMERPRRGPQRRSQILGTFPYMSPEQLRGEPLGPSSDVFSLGTLLYEMATGRHPFPGDGRRTVIAAILRRRPPPPSSLAPDLPTALDRIVAPCLAKRPGRRPTAARLHDELVALRRAREREALMRDVAGGDNRLSLLTLVGILAGRLRLQAVPGRRD